MNGVRLSLAASFPLFADRQQAGGALPTRVKVLGWGRNETSSGTVIVDDITSKVFSTNQKAIGRERVQVDFEHNTVPGTAEYNRTQEPRAVAGHSALICVPGQGIFAEAVTYTADGEKAARNYEDVSLAPFLDKDGRVIAAHSWTVTHTGAAYGLDFKEAAHLSADLKILSATITPKTTMESKTIPLATLAAIAGLDANAEETAILAKFKGALAQPAALSSADLTAALKPFTDKLTALETKLADSEKSTIDLQRAELVTLFAKEGKVPLKRDRTAYTADELKALSLDTLELLLANTAVTVPLSARNAAHQTETSKRYRVKQGDKEVIDLGAIFDDEAARTGLTPTPPSNLNQA